MRLLRELTCEQSNIKREPDLTKKDQQATKAAGDPFARKLFGETHLC